MNRSDRAAPQPSRFSGPAAALRAFLHRAGLSAPSPRPAASAPATPRPGHRLLLAVFSVLLAGVGTLSVAAPAFAANEAPTIYFPLGAKDVHATRATLGAGLSGPVAGGPIHWRIEYSTSPSGPWQLAGEGTKTKELEGGGGFVQAQARQLTSETPYYARIEASNSAGVANGTTEFTTTSVGPPEFRVPPSECEFGKQICQLEIPGPTSARFHTFIESNGAETEYHFEYSTSESGPWTPVVANPVGPISVAEEFAEVIVTPEGLTPEETYFLRAVAVNHCNSAEPAEQCPASALTSFVTHTNRPEAQSVVPLDVAATSVHLQGSVRPDEYETHWRFEFATSQAGPWSPGPEGTIPQAQSAFHEVPSSVEADLSNLSPATPYFVRLFVENANGTDTSAPRGFETAGPPSTEAFATHAIHGEALRLLGSVVPHTAPLAELQRVALGGAPTGGAFTLTFEGETTAPIPYNAHPGTVYEALQALPSLGESNAFASPGEGGFLLQFVGALAGRDLPQLTCDASALTPSGSTCAVATVRDGFSYDTHYSFDYISEAQFKADGETFGPGTESTPNFDLGAGRIAAEGGYLTEIAGADLPQLAPGPYRYRLTATNTTAGNPVVHSSDQSLTVPAPPEVDPQAPCPNAAFRTGPSANLPDCRAYEQVSPIDKNGAQEAFRSGNAAIAGIGTLVGEDGDHFMFLSASTSWGSGPRSGQSPYFFSRDPAAGWQMAAGSPQPEAGFNRYNPELFNPDLTAFAFRSDWYTGGVGVHPSLELEFKAGIPGGPYPSVAKLSRKKLGNGGGWVAASADFSKLILQLEDRELVKPPTTTKSGFDLYEYSAGQLRQLNVATPQAPIGRCGAQMPDEFLGTGGPIPRANSHSVSTDGSRVFFEAVPGTNCAAPKHLYMRTGAAETVDIGEYSFLAANPAGTEVFLQKAAPGPDEYFLYDTDSASPNLLFTSETNPSVDQDLSAIYFAAAEQLTSEAPPPAQGLRNLYRYDVATEALRFIGQTNGEASNADLSLDGRYYYFQSPGLAGLPVGDRVLEEVARGEVAERDGHSIQLYRYDSAQDVVQCVSCASPFDPEPRLGVNNDGGANGVSWQATTPRTTFVSSDGRHAFFETPAPLLLTDVNGEIPPEKLINGHLPERPESTPSNDVYEWRAPGTSGCSRPQGCLSIITPGTDGYLVILFGVAHEGRDVFFSTHTQLLPQDNDSAGDFYDARIDGGFPEPAKQIPCEADSCFHPVPAPNDPTPSSEQFHGTGNVHETKPKYHKKRHHKKSNKKHAKQHKRVGHNQGSHK